MNKSHFGSLAIILLINSLTACTNSTGSGTGGTGANNNVGDLYYLPFMKTIHQYTAVQQGLTGSGVTVAVVDTGIRADHVAFGVRVQTGENTTVYPATSNTADDNGHGSHVAGTLAGESTVPGYDGTVGVAPGVQIIPVKVVDAYNSTVTTAGGGSLEVGLNYASSTSADILSASVGGYAIIPPSQSIGYTDDQNYLAVKANTDAGKLVVFAAGNLSGMNEPICPACFSERPELNGRMMIVGWYNQDLNTVDGNKPGTNWMNYFIVAPGTNITSVDYTTTDGYLSESGSSMATPQVSGAAALIKEKWPTMTAEQIANLLFCTATDLGDPGVDPVFGHGLLNIEAALASGGVCP